MGYAARLNPTARHFATPAGIAKNKAARAEAQRQADADTRAEFDRLVERVQARDAVQRFGVGHVSAARRFLRMRGYPIG